MMTAATPAWAAAASFSSKPPAAPEALVTRYFAPVARSMAAFISWENGPCMAKIWLGDSLASRHSSRDCSMGSTRA